MKVHILSPGEYKLRIIIPLVLLLLVVGTASAQIAVGNQTHIPFISAPASESLATATTTVTSTATPTLTATQPAQGGPTSTHTPTVTPTQTPTVTPTATELSSGPTPSRTPTQTPTITPTATEVVGAVCSCVTDSYNCSDFDTQPEAQACHDYCEAQGRGDIHRLDGNDDDGLACESLPPNFVVIR